MKVLCAEWLWSGWAVKYPNLEIAMSEGGIGWVVSLMDRINNIMSRSGYGAGWSDKQNSPTDVLRRNFWFCMIDNPSTVVTRDTIGIDNILFESDYPHGDGTWPDTQQVMLNVLGELSDEEIEVVSRDRKRNRTEAAWAQLRLSSRTPWSPSRGRLSSQRVVLSLSVVPDGATTVNVPIMRSATTSRRPVAR